MAVFIGFAYGLIVGLSMGTAGSSGGGLGVSWACLGRGGLRTGKAMHGQRRFENMGEGEHTLRG